MKNFLLLLLVSLPILSFSQKEDYVWMLGYGDGVDSTYSTFTMDFNVDPPIIEQRYQDFSFNLSNSSICSPEGELLFYSNSVDIQNNNDEVIINGEDFQGVGNYPNGLPVIQSSIFLPYPDKENEYLYFTSDLVIFNNTQGVLTIGGSPLNYSIVRKNLNGDWELINKKTPLTQDTLLIDQLTSVKHANGRDWWIINSKDGTNIFYRFLLSPEGISFEGVQNIGDNTDTSLGQSSFSPDGNWYARYNWVGNLPSPTWKRVDLYRFDRCTGLLSEHQHELLPGNGATGGVSFSPNSELLYVSAWDSIYQYDLTASDIFSSRQMVAATDEFITSDPIPAFTKFFMMQLAPNDKIYISVANISSRYLHVIDQPNEKGTACNVLQHHIELPTYNDKSLPNLPNYRLKAEIGSPCDTLRPIAQFNYTPDALDVTFTDQSQRTPTEWLWTFGDGTTSTEQNPQHIYQQQDIYEVCLVASNEAGSDTTCQMVDIILDDVEDISLAKAIKISPNPTDGNVVLELPEDRLEDWEIEVFDSYGRVLLMEVLPRGEERHSLFLSEFPAGIYFYKISDGLQILKVGKVVKE